MLIVTGENLEHLASIDTPGYTLKVLIQFVPSNIEKCP